MAVPLGLGSLGSGLRAMFLDESVRISMTSRREEVVRELSWEEPLSQTEALYQGIIEKIGERK